MLEIAPSTYWTPRPGRRRPGRSRDAVLRPQLRALWVKNYSVYGRRKLTKAARRAGLDVGRDQVARLMRADGHPRREPGEEAVHDPRRSRRGARPGPACDRDFTATAPEREVGGGLHVLLDVVRRARSRRGVGARAMQMLDACEAYLDFALWQAFGSEIAFGIRARPSVQPS